MKSTSIIFVFLCHFKTAKENTQDTIKNWSKENKSNQKSKI